MIPPAWSRHSILRHVVLPAILPVLFFLVLASPVSFMGCRNRGLVAVLIALAGALGALGATVISLKGKSRRSPKASWWLTTALLLILPALFILAIAN